MRINNFLVLKFIEIKKLFFVIKNAYFLFIIGFIKEIEKLNF